MLAAQQTGQSPGLPESAQLPSGADVEGWIAQLSKDDEGARTVAATELGRFYDAVSAWPAERFDGERARGYVALVSLLVSVDRLEEAIPQLQKALDLAARERLGQYRASLAAEFCGRLQLQGRLQEAVAAGMRELEWLCTQASGRNAVCEAMLADVVVDAGCRIYDWRSVERVIQLLPAIEAQEEQQEEKIDAPWRAAMDVLIAQCRFRHALMLGQPERAGRFLEREAERAKAMGSIPIAATLKAGLWIDRAAHALAVEDFAGAEDTAAAGVRELTAPGTPRAAVQPHVERLQFGRGLALIMLGRPAEADALLAALPDDQLEARLQRAWIAYAARDQAAFAALAGIPDAAVRDCKDDLLRAGIAGMQLQAILCAPADGASAPARRAKLQQIERDLQAVFAAMLRSVAAAPARLGGVGYFHFEQAQQVLADLVAVQRALHPGAEGDRLALQTVLRAEAQGSLMRSLPAQGPRAVAAAAAADLATVQQHLPGDAVALVFVPSRFGSGLFALAKDRLQYHELPPRTQFDDLAWQITSRLPASVESEPDAGLLADLERLRPLLLPDAVLPQIDRYQHWIVVAAGGLTNLPFEALPLPDGRLAGEAHAVSNLSSLPLRSVLQPRPSTARSPRLMLFANLAPDGVGPWLRPLLEPFTKPVCRQDAEASRTAFCSAQLDQFDIVHVLAHGVRDPQRELSWGIQLGRDAASGRPGDGALWPEDVIALAPSGLVILSVCRVARAPRRLGEDHAGNLGGAFLHAGAAAVVQSRAAIQLRETCELMARFHAHLARGEPWAEALRAARAALPLQPFGARLHAAQLQLTGWSR